MKKAITLLFAVVSVLWASFSLAASPSVQAEESRAAAISQLMQTWQSRILAFGLPVDDAKNWSRRNMAKFSRLNAERLALAQRASTLDELELALLDAPIPPGTHLDVLMANKPGDITMMGARNVAKSSPATAPAAYAGLVFTAVTTCRILDSRVSQGGSGPWTAGSSNLVKIGPYATGYASGSGAQGGSATSCGLDALAGPGQVAAILAAVSTVTQAGPGYLTFYPQGAPNPGLRSVSQWYQPGYVQTSFVLIPTDLVGTVAASGYTSNATEVIIDVVGYFAAEPPEGTVTAITAGTGLTGGTITTAGTLAIASAYQLPQACANGQVAQSNGAGVWSCVTPSASSGTVTSVATGSGLTGGPITSTGTIALAATNLLPTTACATNQIAKWSGSAWACAADASSGGTVTGVSASAPLASSGGSAPNISLTGTIPVANGGTGQTTLAANGIVYGQGTAALGTAVGIVGQVLAGTAGAPVWTGSPSISGNLTLVNPSTASAGNILKGANRFIHNFGSANTFIGENAGNFTMIGGYNTASGASALQSNTIGGYNTASGASALQSNTTGFYNTASGTSALFSNTTGDYNTASGTSALFSNTTGINNTASGAYALQSNTIGIGNTASGLWALQSNTTGSGNTASGVQALQSNTTGVYNTASGVQALYSNTTGYRNTASGASALYSNTTGNYNTASGLESLFSNTTGYYNTASGVRALYYNTTGNSNTASGLDALQSNTTGTNNTASGKDSLPSNTTGSNNIALGYRAGFNLTTGNFNINIGHSGVAAEGNTIRIGDSNQTRTFIAGIRGVTTGSATAIPVLIDSDGQLGTMSSSRRFKDDIAAMDAASSALMKLRPVTFHYKTDRNPSGRTLQYGLIAEEVAAVYPGLVAHSADGQVETVMYQFLPSMLLNEYQKQQRTMEAQTTHIAKLEQDRQLQTAAIATQAGRIAELERERGTHTAEIAGLKAAVAEIAELKRQTAHLARLLGEQRSGTLSAGLELK